MATRSEGMGDRVRNKMREMKGKAEKMMGGRKSSKTARAPKSAGRKPGPRH